MKNFIVVVFGFAILAASSANRNIEGKFVPATSTAITDTLRKEIETGFVIDKDLYMVKAQCTSCHSSKLITQNRFTRDGWKQKIRWMQAKHNLWDLGETEKQVLDYLEKYYAPTAAIERRQSLKDIKWYKLQK